jgi:hypothetical protein
MTDVKKKSTRRAFFLNGGAVLGAGVAATTAATGLALAATPQASAGDGAGAGVGALGTAEDREAIRQLHLAFVARLEADATVGNQADATVRELFDEPVQLGAYRQTSSQRKDEVAFSEDGLQATATFHCEVELCTPLLDDCTAAQMARLQGLMANRRWESGRFEASYEKSRGQWRMTAVSYTRA